MQHKEELIGTYLLYEPSVGDRDGCYEQKSCYMVQGGLVVVGGGWQVMEGSGGWRVSDQKRKAPGHHITSKRGEPQQTVTTVSLRTDAAVNSSSAPEITLKGLQILR